MLLLCLGGSLVSGGLNAFGGARDGTGFTGGGGWGDGAGTTGLGLGAGGVTRGTVEGLWALTSRPGFGTGLLLITLPAGPMWLATGLSGV